MNTPIINKLLAIDPGPTYSALLVWDVATQSIDRTSLPEIIKSDLVCETIGLLQLPVACEHLQCFGMAVGAEVFQTAYWIGEYRATCRLECLPFRPVFRMEVKNAICHNSRATDSNIRQAIIDRLGPPGTKKAPGATFGIKADLWSALAIALTVGGAQREMFSPAEEKGALKLFV